MRLFVLIGCFLTVVVTNSKAFSADADANSGASIIIPLAISNDSDLFFGSIVPSTSATDTVVVSSAGAKTCGANLTCLSADHTAAAYTVTGEPDNVYTITLPTTVALSNGVAGTMNVTSFTSSKATGTLSGGTDTFSVGGTLTVFANQQAGDYVGTFTVTVEYQ